MSDDDLEFCPEDSSESSGNGWPILVIDDEPSVHDVTRLLLKNFRFDKRPIELLHALSGEEARAVLAKRQDIAVVLLDVVMETDHAGLEVARHIREDLQDDTVRIVLRTGQPGMAPEREVVTRYGIDEYRSKTELTADRMFTVIHSALSSYRRLSEMQSTRKDLEQLTYIASHDLKSPLRQIGSFSRLLDDSLNDGEPDLEKSRKYLDFIVAGTKNATRLLEDLIDLSTAGRAGTPHSVFWLGEALLEAIENIGMTSLSEAVHYDKEQLPHIEGNYRYMCQLFQNLIGNALKFNTEPTAAVWVRCRKLEGSLLIDVADNGPGVSAENMDALFSPFQRGQGTADIEGNGIGLAICKRVADFHSGSLSIGRADEGGACFTLRLPGDIIRNPT